MAGCGYHSPQFSEDIAWLPEWLQPHQPPAFGDCAKDSQTLSQHAFKNLAVFQKSTSNGQDGPLFTRGDAIYSGCHLFLSGEDDSPVGNTRLLELYVFVQTTKFLYGRAINTWMLNSNWLADSVKAGSVMPPGKYMTRPIKPSERKCLRIGEPLSFNNHTFIFHGVGIMLYGKSSYCTIFCKIRKVFKTLQRLVQSLKNGRNSIAAILVEDEDSVSRHLKYCALEQNLQTLSSSWFINSLFSGLSGKVMQLEVQSRTLSSVVASRSPSHGRGRR